MRGRRPGRGWVPVSHGLYAADNDKQSALRAWQLLLPSDGCFTHVTGAEVRGWWLPPLPEGLPVFVAMSRNGARPLREGIRTIRLSSTPSPDTIDGLRVACPVEILLACARDFAFLDLVVLVDSVFYASDVTMEELVTACAQRRRGAPALRAALAWTDPRSESAWETLLRIFHRICDVAVEAQYELSRRELVARGDLWLVGTRLSTSTTAVTI